MNKTVVAEFVAEHTFCWRCGIKSNLDTHHISQRRRWDVRENLARLCRTCHDMFHFGRGFTLAQVLELKRRFDSAWFSETVLLELLCVKGLP